MSILIMKKICFFALAFILIFSFPISASAENNMISSGHTKEGMYYEVYGEISIQSSGETIPVSREIIISGKIYPDAEIFWQESIKGYVYSGTLYLKRYFYDKASNQTIATYEGTLTAE